MYSTMFKLLLTSSVGMFDTSHQTQILTANSQDFIIKFFQTLKSTGWTKDAWETVEWRAVGWGSVLVAGWEAVLVAGWEAVLVAGSVLGVGRPAEGRWPHPPCQVRGGHAHWPPPGPARSSPYPRPKGGETDKYRREGKGRRCCFGDRIYSIPCGDSYSLLLDDLKNTMCSSYYSNRPKTKLPMSPKQQRRPWPSLFHYPSSTVYGLE